MSTSSFPENTAPLENSFNVTVSTPWKMLQCKSAVTNGRIVPVHIKIYPTDRCNARCSFCSIDRTATGRKQYEMPTAELLEVIDHFHSLGTRAVTLSGGGEPTLHPGFDEIIAHCQKHRIKIGTLTNGILWHDKKKEIFANGRVEWARISLDVQQDASLVDRVATFIANMDKTRLGIYMVATKRMSPAIAEAIVKLGEDAPNVTHIKIVADIESADNTLVEDIEKTFKATYPKLILQKNGVGAPGRSPCRIPLLKPIVGADGNIYSCPRYENVVPMMHWREFSDQTPPFPGGPECSNCLWDEYNYYLDGLITPLQDEWFV